MSIATHIVTSALTKLCKTVSNSETCITFEELKSVTKTVNSSYSNRLHSISQLEYYKIIRRLKEYVLRQLFRMSKAGFEPVRLPNKQEC